MMRIKDVTDDFVTVEVRETLVPQDYSIVMPELVRLDEKSHGSLNVLVELLDFRGWEPPELGTRARFGVAPLGASGRVAVVGADGGSGRRLARPLFRGEVRTFPLHARAEAEAWLSEGAS
jgi:hypothetical protein